MKRLFLVVLFLAAAGIGAWWYWKRGTAAPVQYRTAKIERGDLLVTVTATGTIQPVNPARPPRG